MLLVAEKIWESSRLWNVQVVLSFDKLFVFVGGKNSLPCFRTDNSQDLLCCPPHASHPPSLCNRRRITLTARTSIKCAGRCALGRTWVRKSSSSPTTTPSRYGAYSTFCVRTDTRWSSSQRRWDYITAASLQWRKGHGARGSICFLTTKSLAIAITHVTKETDQLKWKILL